MHFFQIALAASALVWTSTAATASQKYSFVTSLKRTPSSTPTWTSTSTKMPTTFSQDMPPTTAFPSSTTTAQTTTRTIATSAFPDGFSSYRCGQSIVSRQPFCRWVIMCNSYRGFRQGTGETVYPFGASSIEECANAATAQPGSNAFDWDMSKTSSPPCLIYQNSRASNGIEEERTMTTKNGRQVGLMQCD